MGKIKAPIDGKNVTTDWIEEIFDGMAGLVNGKQAVGYILDHPVYAFWYHNVIVWQFIDIGEDITKPKAELRKRLDEREDKEVLFSECYGSQHSIYQHFYFNND